MGLVRSEHARSSFERIFTWAQEAGMEVVEVAASWGGATGELRAGHRSNRTPAGRVGAGIGWTVALPSGRHYGALREITVATDAKDVDRIRGAVLNVAEAEVTRELAALTNWVPGPGTAIRHLTEADFYDALLADLDAAGDTILILAPFLGHRFAQVVPALTAARDRGVAVTVLVRPQHAAKASIQKYLDPLRAAGMQIVERTNRMHEKVVVVDERVAYHGSLNPLSHKFTNESMVRFDCPPIAESFYVLYHPKAGQGFAERIEIRIFPNRGRAESRLTWGDPTALGAGLRGRLRAF
jgi:hypothetical protein